MSIVINYPFTNPLNYTFVASEVKIESGLASLKLQVAAQSFTQDFSSDAGFVYDNAKAEFTAGVVRQLDITPLNSVFGVNFDIDAPVITNEADLNWNKDSGVTAVLNGAPTIAASQLVCIGGQGLYYMRNTSLAETHKFKYTPNYTDAPSSNINLVGSHSGTNNNDRVTLTHSPSGDNLRITLGDNIGTILLSTVVIGPSNLGLVLGVEYEIELVVDSVLGTVRVFLDGVLIGTQTPGAWTRDINLHRYWLGASTVVYNVADGSFKDYITFSDAQHTADYVPGYTIDNTIYIESLVTLPQFSKPLGDIFTLDSLAVVAFGIDRYTLNMNGGAYLYFDGSSWANSDGSFTQSNALADINTNLPTFPNAQGMTAGVRLHFSDNNIQGQLDDLVLGYTGETNYLTTNPKIIPTTVFAQDALQVFLSDFTVTGLDDVKFTLEVGGQERWFDGAIWASSNGTYAQANTLLEVQANLATFGLIGATKPVVFLHSDDGLSTPTVDFIDIQFDFFGGSAIVDNKCVVWGYLFDSVGAPAIGVTVVATPTSFGIITDKLINRSGIIVTTNATGYWEMELIETQTAGDNWAYEFTMPGYVSRRFVPDAPTAQFNTLIVQP